MDIDRVDELYRRHVPAALAFACLLVGGDRPLAEDLVHDAFIRAVGRRVSLRDDRAFDAYLHRSVANAVTSWHRRRAVERRWLQRQSITSSVSEGADVEASEEALRLLRALPPRQRVAVAARVCLDLSEAQVAELLGCSVGTVKSLTSRGLAALRDAETQEVAP